MKRVFVSYTADSEEHRARVLALVHQLRREGVDATSAAVGPRLAAAWSAQAIEAADFVLVICTERYRRAFDEHGVQGGAAAVISRFAARRVDGVVPVLLEDGAPQHVPLAFRSAHPVYLPEQMSELLRRLGATGEPAPPLPADEVAWPAAPPPPERPGKRPERRIANVSLLGTADFVGRTFELSAIRTAMAAPRQGGVREPLIVIGAAGIGKTALVLQHAFRQQDSYDVLWLVRAQAESTIRLDLARLARELGLLGPGVGEEGAEVLAARSWLAANDRWLLIFDEAAGIDAIAPYVPSPLRGDVLVTSRGSDWRDAGKKMLLGALAREETIDLLLRTSGRSDGAGADELAAWLEGHPLMARLTGALARDRGVAFDVLHKQLVVHASVRPGPRLEVVLAVAEEDARQRSPAILALVELIAYLAPHEIPIRLLREHVEHLAPELAAVARDDNALARLLDDVVRLGIATRDDSSLSVHAAVQRAIRANASSGAAVALLAAAFAWDEERPETWAAAEELLPHVLVAIEDPHAPYAQSRALQRLLARTAACLWKRGEPARAIELQRRAIAGLDARSFPLPFVPVDDDDVRAARIELASACTTLGGMLREVGELAEAAEGLERALELLSRIGGTLDLVPVLREAARLAVARGDLAGARVQLEHALHRERLGGGDRLSIAVTLSDLSGVEAEAGRLDEAAELLEQALEVQRRLLATDEHPVVAATLRSSAVILVRRGDLAGARARLERAIEVLRRVYKTEHHVAIADATSDLAKVLMRLGDLIGAQRLLEQTLESLAKLFGSGANPRSAAVSQSLARALIEQGDITGARRQLERTLAEMQAHGLMLDGTVATILELLGELDAVGDLVAARARHEEALAIRRQLSDPSSPEVIRTTAYLARIVARLGQVEEAARLLEPILEHLAIERSGQEAVTVLPGHRLHLVAPEALYVAAGVLRRLGRTVTARDLLASAIAARQRDAPHDELELAHSRLELARAHLELDEIVEARQTARAAHDVFASILGRTSLAAGTAAALRAEIALRGGEPASAFGHARRALAAFGGDDALSREWAARGLALAAWAARALGRPATAAALFQRSLERRDAPEVRDALFEMIEDLAEAGSRYDAAPAVALLAKLAPSWLADRVFATAALESAQITTQLEVSLAIASACAGAVLAYADGLASGYGWRLELAPIRADGVASEVRTLAPRARYAGRGRLVLLASTADLPWGTYLLTVRFFDSPRDVWRADVTVSNVELGNPFLAGPPVKGERFFGRARLLDDVLRNLEDASIALLGPRRSGKTSVLYRLAQLCADTWTVVMVDLHGYSGVEDRVFLRELAGQIARAAGIEEPEADRPLHALRRALGAAGTRQVLLLLDEMAVLARYPDVALQLRAMSKWSAPQVRIVIAGTSRDLDRLTITNARGSSPVNEFLNRELDQLTHEEARSLLEQPVLGRYNYEPAALEGLIELGAGRPFFLNALAHLALEEVRKEGTRAVTAAHVEAARQEAPSSLARWYRELVGELDDATRAALPALIDAGGQIPPEHGEALRSAGIVVGPRRAMALDPIFTDWWRRGGPR